jgi:anti-anti-sigma factor
VSPDTGEWATSDGRCANQNDPVHHAAGAQPGRLRADPWRLDVSNIAELDLAASRLIADEASIIYVDLGGVTFIASTLVAFLVQVCNGGGERRPFVLCRPTRLALRVIRMTGLDEFAIVHAELPLLWPFYAGDPEPSDRQRERSPERE